MIMTPEERTQNDPALDCYRNAPLPTQRLEQFQPRVFCQWFFAQMIYPILITRNTAARPPLQH
jgi:hypothetical protein